MYDKKNGRNTSGTKFYRSAPKMTVNFTKINLYHF